MKCVVQRINIVSIESSLFSDKTITAWIDEHKDNLRMLYDDYCLEMNDTMCTFEDFAVYMFNEYKK